MNPTSSASARSRLFSPAAIAAAYAIAAALWILFSDRLVAAMASDSLHLSTLQTYKGWGFVAVTAALLFLLLRRARGNQAALDASLEQHALQYRRLFELNPQPMWICDVQTRAILAVNQAALDHYGYTRDEFLSMTTADIGVPAGNGVQPGSDGSAISCHRKKNGELIDVEVTASALSFDGRHAEMVLAHDVTLERSAQRRVAAAEERLRLALTAARQGLYDLNVQTGEAQINDVYAEMLGYAPGELVETNQAWLERLHPDDRERAGRIYGEYIAGKLPEYRVEFRQRTKQGDWKWILSLGRLMERDARGEPLRMLGTNTDIDAEKRAQGRIRRLTNLYAALSQCNQAIMRISDRGELLRQICRVAVDFGGLRMAWIGELRDATVVPVASFGARSDYIDDTAISLDPDTPAGRGPTAIAMREQRHIVCDDIEGDRSMAPWRERALACGFRASAAFPLICAGKAVGALNLYAPEARFFDAELVDLLDEMALDISQALDRFRLDAERESAERRFRTLVDHAADAVFVADLDGRIIDVNARACETLGYAREELIGRNVADVDPTAATLGAADVRKIHAAALESGQLHHGRHRRKDGSTFPVEVRIAGVRLGDSDFVIGMARDVTERERAEGALQYSEQRFRRISQAMSDIAYSCRSGAGGEFEVDWMMGAAERITGYTADEIMARRCWRCLVVEEDQGLFRERVIGLAPGTGGSCELRLRRKDGGIVWVASVADCIHDDGDASMHRLYGGLVDISERKRAEADRERLLAEAEAAQRRLRQVLDRITDGFVALDRDWNYVFINDRGAQALGRRAEDLIGRHIWTEFPEAVSRAFRDAAERAIAQQAPVTLEDYVAPWDRWLESHLYPSAEGLTVVFQDVTQRKRVARELAQSEARLRRVVDEMPVLFDAFDEQGTVIHWNRECERVTGYSAAEIVGNPAAMELLYPDAAYRQHMLGTWKERGHAYRDWEWSLTAKDGGIRHISWSNISGDVPIPGWPVWGVGVDVTARRTAEAALAGYTERLQSLSRRLLSVQEEEKRALARELHDEIGQQLAALKLNLNVMVRDGGAPPDPRRLTDCVEIAELTIERIRDAALNLRPSVLDDLGLVSAMHWYARRQAQRAACRIEVHAAAPLLPGDVETALFRIVQEAVNNAIRHGRAPRIEVTLAMVGDSAHLRIEDDGVGFDVAAAGMASMGLLSMRERAELLGGRFAIDSRPGAGTRIEAEIPLDLATT